MAASPYLNIQGDFFGNLPQYQLQVQPFADTQSSIGQHYDQLQGIQRRAAQATRGPATRQRSGTFGARNASALVTGHPTRFMTYSHYYPAPANGRRR